MRHSVKELAERSKKAERATVKSRLVRALAGKLLSNGTVTLYSSTGTLYVRLNGSARNVREVADNGWSIMPNAHLFVEQVDNNSYILKGIDWQREYDRIGENFALNTAPYARLDLTGSLVGPRNYIDARFYQVDPVAHPLRVSVYEFQYTDTNGDLQRWLTGQSYVDLTVPPQVSSVNQQAYVHLYLDNTAGAPALAQVQQTSADITDPTLTRADADANTVTSGLPLWAFYLRTTDTALPGATPETFGDLYVDERPWLSLGGGTGGGSMSSFDVAADSGTPATVNDGETLSFVGGTAITTAISGNTVTITSSTGANGVDAGLAIHYNFSTTTTAADPGSGNLRLNNATQTSATHIYADLLDRSGVDWSTALDTFDDSTSAVLGTIRLSKYGTVGQVFILFNLTAVSGPSGYLDFTLSFLTASGSNPFANGDHIILSFTPTGYKGDAGAASTVVGPTGGGIAVNYTFSTTTTDSDPGTGGLRLNQATQNTATQLFVDLLDNLSNADWTTVLDSLDDSTNTNKGDLRLFKTDQPSHWITFTLTGVTTASGYRKLIATVTGYSAANPFANNNAVTLAFTRTGDAGTNGTDGNDGADSTVPGPAGGMSLLTSNVSTVGNVGTGEDDLMTYAVPANTLTVNGDVLTFEASGTLAISASERVRVKFGSTTLLDTGALNLAAAADFRVTGSIIRVGATSQRCITTFTSSSAVLLETTDYVAATEDLTTSLTLKLTGDATTTNDVQQTSLTVGKLSTTSASGSVIVTEADGTPSVVATTIKFSNGTVTDNGDGSVSVSSGGGGGGSADGWTAITDTCTYAGADAPTFTFTISGDVTANYWAGLKLKISQSTGGTKYFFITKVAYSSPNTTVTIYGGTDYTLNNETISTPYYSRDKAPQGFPLNPAKWTVTVTSSSNLNQASPTTNTWYNKLTISAPTGAWRGYYKAFLDGERSSSTYAGISATLSTANNTESNSEWTVDCQNNGASATDFRVWQTPAVDGYIEVAAKTDYYFNIKTNQASMTLIALRGDLVPTLLRLTSAYL